MDSWGLYLSRIFLEFSPKPVYSTMAAEKFQIYSVTITANTFVEIVYVTTGNSAFCLTLYLSGVHFLRVTASWWRQWAKNQIWTNQNSGNRWCQIARGTICESKNWICSILLMPPSKTPPQVFIIIPQADRNCPFFSNNIFWRYFFLSRKKGETIMELKKLPTLTRVLVTSFGKFYHLCNLQFFGFMFCCAII